MSNYARPRTPSAYSSRGKSPSPAPSKMSSFSQQTTAAKYNKPRVHLLDTCYICGNNFSSARQTIGHVERIHGYQLPSRRQGYKRPQNKYIEYVRERNAEWDHQEIACPSCWFHCPEDDLLDFNQHTRDTHNPKKVNPEKEGDDGYESAASAVSAASEASRRSSQYRKRRSGSVASDQRSTTGAREGSAPAMVDEKTAKEISAKLDDLTKIFKSLFSL